MEATGGMMTSSSPVASHNYVNHTQVQESDLERKMTATSGQKCLEQFEKFNRVGLWAKTFADLLIGMEGWYSMKCKLTWKLKATKLHRFYFQLVPSTPHTEGIEFGLLPTPESYDWNSARHPELWERDKKKYAEKGINLHCNLRQQAKLGMLPTPTAMNCTNATATMKSTQVKEGSMHSVTLTRAMSMGMLPTPMASEIKAGHGDFQNSLTRMVKRGEFLPTPQTRDWKGCEGRRGDLPSYVIDEMKINTGKTSQLSPQFVMEMMGFPTDWTLLPFLSGETSQSKQEGMQ